METITVNKRKMQFHHSGGVYSLPVLYSTDKMGRVRWWKISERDGAIQTVTAIVGGKEKETAPCRCVPKNVGRANETTAHTQALFEMYSRWVKQLERPGTRVERPEGAESAEGSACPTPMLAQPFERRKKYIRVPFAVSRKLDGVRMIARRGSNGDIILSSRNGKLLKFLANIRKSLAELFDTFGELVLDGELYSHDMPFNEISGIARQTKHPSKAEDRVQYWIFDVIADRPYRDRARLLSALAEKPLPGLCYELYETCDRLEDVSRLHDEYVRAGFEGAIVRNLDAPYIPYRSNDLQKYKEFCDREFPIDGYKVGRGVDEGAIIYVCRAGDERFDVRPRGSLEYRRELAMAGDACVGKMLTVRFQATGKEDGSLPRFPVGIAVRDYE
jgi:ATP-dependent DNA ligase